MITGPPARHTRDDEAVGDLCGDIADGVAPAAAPEEGPDQCSGGAAGSRSPDRRDQCPAASVATAVTNKHLQR